MINTIFHFVNDPTFDYQTAVNNGDISEYTIVFNSADHSIHCKSAMFGRMSRADMTLTLGNISDLIPVATDSTLGGIKIGYISDTDQHSRRYGVVLDSNNKAYVEVPWTDTITPVFDDSLLIQLINLLRQRIDDYITQQTQLISERTLTLFNDTLWVTNNLQQGQFGHWIKETDIEYMRQYGVWDYEYDPSTIVYSAWLYNDAGTTSLGTGKVMFTGNELSGLKEIIITECTDSTLVNTTYYMVSSFAADGESLYQLFTNTFATSGKAIKLLFYSGTPLTDPVTGEPLISIKTSVVQQQADKMYQRVGLVVGDINDINTWQGNIDNWKNNTAAEKSYVTTAIGNLEQLVGIDPQTGAISSVTNLSNQVADVDASTKAVEKAVLASLDLKALKNSDGTFEAITDLAAFYEDQTGKTLYSGLNNRVSTAEGTIISQGSLITTALTTANKGVTDAAAAKNAADAAQADLNLYKQTVASAGFATTAWVQNNTDASGAASTAETNAKNYADTKKSEAIASANASMFATIDTVCAGIGVTVTKNSDGTYDSVALVSADDIFLNGQTWAQYIGVGQIVADTLSAGTATIDAATIDAATITGTLSGVNGTFSGELSAATGSFSGEVSASEFIAGDSVNGFSINIVPLAFQFNWKGTPLAWFSLCDWDSTNNTFAAPTSNPKGFYLYMRNPVDGHMITIDFANISNGFKDLNANSNPVYTYPLYSITRLNGNVAYDPVISQDRDVYYTDVNGTKTWYSNSQGTTALSSVSGYRKASINYSQGPNNGSPMLNPYVLKRRSSTGPYDLVKADVYIGLTLSGGQVVDDTSKIVVVVTDTDGHYKICTPISGNPKSVSGASNVYYQGVLSNNFAGGHRDVGTSSTSVSAYVVDLASTTGNIYSGNSVTYFDNNNHTTSMLATTYPAAS